MIRNAKIYLLMLALVLTAGAILAGCSDNAPPAEYQIEFVTNGASQKETLTVTDGATLDIGANPTRAGWFFAG
jgi:hypothetical protein